MKKASDFIYVKAVVVKKTENTECSNMQFLRIVTLQKSKAKRNQRRVENASKKVDRRSGAYKRFNSFVMHRRII